MAHMVETMFSYRQVPWHGLGRIVEEAPDSKTAIKLAELDWTVEQEQIQLVKNGVIIKDFYANVRSADDSVLGIVSGKYKIVQNYEAFEFTDVLLGEGVKYEAAGSLCNGKKVWLLAKLEDRFKLVGDDTEVYLGFFNNHDGKGSVRAFITPVRVVCWNTLNMALKNASRSWSTIHAGSMQEKLKEAQRTLELTHIYMNKLSETAEILADKKITNNDVTEFTEMLFPIGDDMSDRKKNNIIDIRQELLYRYNKAPDLKKFNGTAWGLVGAVSDLVSHSAPRRNTKTFAENRFDKVVTGHPIFDKATELLLVA